MMIPNIEEAARMVAFAHPDVPPYSASGWAKPNKAVRKAARKAEWPLHMTMVRTYQKITRDPVTRIHRRERWQAQEVVMVPWNWICELAEILKVGPVSLIGGSVGE